MTDDKLEYFTRSGDDGYTSVLGRERVPKYALRPEACGTVDEASAALGIARAAAQNATVKDIILQVQRDLSPLMADLATVPENATLPPWLPEERLTWLEQTIETAGQTIQLPKAFVVPGDCPSGAALDLARTIIRRAERVVARLLHEGDLRSDTPLRYLNRLSSLLFILARVEDKASGVSDSTLAR
jgi:cob(I)alamin adenosyltransferase